MAKRRDTRTANGLTIKKLYIIDNGESYSDHALEFVDATGCERAMVESYVLLTNVIDGGNNAIIGEASDALLTPGATPLMKLIERTALRWSTHLVASLTDATAFRRLEKAYREVTPEVQALLVDPKRLAELRPYGS